MKLKNFEIVIDNPIGVFCPGEVVSAHVIVEPIEELKLREIRAKCVGYAEVHWTEKYSTSEGGTRTEHYRNRENYFEQKAVVLGKERGKKDNIVLQPGSYKYPVSFTLPTGIPSSYEAHIGRVRYHIYAIIDRPWAFDKHALTVFTVANLLDLNEEPGLMNEVEVTDHKVLCCLCCASNPIIATVKLPRTGYVPGEMINFDAEIENRSNTVMKRSVVKLIMRVKYHATDKTKTVNNTLFRDMKGRIAGGSTDVWKDVKMLIPPVPPSYLLGCNIIDIKYIAMITVIPKGCALDLEVPVEVVIGSIPFISVAQQYGVDVKSTKGSHSDQGYADIPTVQILHYCDQDRRWHPIPQPWIRSAEVQGERRYENGNTTTKTGSSTYAESAFGRVDTRVEGDDENTTGNSSYAPVYSYYNWNKQDPSKLFAVQMDED